MGRPDASHNKEAVLISIEDRQDAKELNRAIREWEKEGRPTVPLGQALKELGLSN